jgi:hypothetical protein
MLHTSRASRAPFALRVNFQKFLILSAAVLGVGHVSLAQNGSPSRSSLGVITSVAGQTNPILTSSLFDGVAFKAPNTLYVSDSHVTGAGSASVTNANIFAVDLTTGQVTRIAGPPADPTSGNSGYSGDGGPALNAKLNKPAGLALDSAGNLYIADSGQNVVRKIDTSGNISTVAGNGDPSLNTSSGDGGQATSAKLTFPTAVAVNAAGDLYISDTLASRVRLVNATTHIITTFAGNGVAGFSGDGGPATSATINQPSGLTLDSNNTLYIADRNNNVIRQVSSSGVINTLAGQAGQTGFNDGPGSGSLLASPYDVAVDAANNVYVADSGNNRIRMIATDGSRTVTTVAGNGSAANSGDGGSPLSAALHGPTSLTASPGGDLFFADNSFTAVRRVLNGLYFVPLQPCRVVDTRWPTGTFGGPFLAANQTRSFAIRYSSNIDNSSTGRYPGACGSAQIPSDAQVQAYSLNVTVVPRRTLSWLTVSPSNSSVDPRSVSTLNSYDGRTKANAAIVPADTTDNNRAISVFGTDDTDVIVDINGYYVPGTSSSLAFYPVAPCRAVDTRDATRVSGLGIPNLQAGETRTFSLQSSGCGLPNTAQAYALNFTAVPRTNRLGFLSVWPGGQSQPIVSTLNATTGTVTANAAIVPVGSSGQVSAYTTDPTDLIIDVSGYYAPPGSGELALYNVTPCRAYDSRGSNLQAPPLGTGSGSQNAAGGGCSGRIATTAQSIVMNSTVIPAASLSFLTLWAQGAPQPLQSTLNAYDASVTSNLAVVPATSGNVAYFVTAPTGLIYDVFGYFAP